MPKTLVRPGRVQRQRRPSHFPTAGEGGLPSTLNQPPPAAVANRQPPRTMHQFRQRRV